MMRPERRQARKTPNGTRPKTTIRALARFTKTSHCHTDATHRETDVRARRGITTLSDHIAIGHSPAIPHPSRTNYASRRALNHVAASPRFARRLRRWRTGGDRGLLERFSASPRGFHDTRCEGHTCFTSLCTRDKVREIAPRNIYILVYFS